MTKQNGVSLEITKNKLPAIVDGFDNAVDDVLDKGVQDVVASAKRIVVQKDIFDTGNLLNGIMENQSARRPGHREADSTAEYSGIHEFGGHGNAARPFMGPAPAENEGPIIANVGRAITKLAR